jgi:hypothetical protein
MKEFIQIIGVFLIIFVTGCTTVETPEKELELSVQIEGGGITAKSGETVIIEAVVSNAAADDISYTWYVYDTEASSTTRVFNFSSSPEGLAKFPITVQVSDGISTASARTYVTFEPKQEIILIESKVLVSNLHPSLSGNVDEEISSRLFFQFYLEFVNLKNEDVEYCRVYDASGRYWPLNIDTLLDKNNRVWINSINCIATHLSSNNSVVPIKQLKLGIALKGGEKTEIYFTLPVPGDDDDSGISYIYTEDYSGIVTPDYHPALARAVIEKSEFIEDLLLIYFILDDKNAENIRIWFGNDAYGSIGFTDHLINIYSREVAEALNDSEAFFTNGQSNTLRITPDDINFTDNYSITDINFFSIEVTDGIRNVSYDERFRIEYISHSEKIKLFVQ